MPFFHIGRQFIHYIIASRPDLRHGKRAGLSRPSPRCRRREQHVFKAAIIRLFLLHPSSFLPTPSTAERVIYCLNLTLLSNRRSERGRFLSLFLFFSAIAIMVYLPPPNVIDTPARFRFVVRRRRRRRRFSPPHPPSLIVPPPFCPTPLSSSV